MKILYFAWLRERIGLAEEEIDLPAEVATVGALAEYLAGRGPAHARAFAARQAIKAAVDQRFVPPETPLAGATEIAFFPPFTGG
ncbi:MAG: molybdopterin converting factor subunit 1 [Acidiphilium sp. 37-67-22]|nr:MAG: molybdopterin converting factor subunit 1 [Acidiphilium sp. 21-66-27]OYW09791.1 MAG: molybdopterin converting factor subunit 1 [Acidiphilium sp. 37-67-22]HQT74026.1 molybdopterin converting factor subunit 1 [Acidiphilium sp.]